MSLANYPNYSTLVFLHATLLCFMIYSKLASSSTISTTLLGNETDRLSLLRFKESIPRDPRGILGSWNDSVHFCNWPGVKCGVRHRRVTSLSLEGYGLQGTISPHIGNLSFLRLIKLGNNSFSGEVPQQVGHLFRLRNLNLSFNILEGKIPVNLSHCSQLRVLYLRKNKLTGNIPAELGSLANLGILSLAENSLTGRISPSLGNISSLRAFDLTVNNLEGLVPDELGKLKGLIFFGTGINNLSGTFPRSLYNMSSLITLDIAVNRLKGTLPSTIGLTLPKLTIFLVSLNEFSGRIPESLSNASQLQMLMMGGNNFGGQVPTSLGNLQNLFKISLFYNKLGNYSANDWGFLASLTNCSALNYLSLAGNNFGGVLPKTIANLSTTLSTLTLGDNGISGNIPSTLANLVNLTDLGLEYNLFSGIIPASFGKLQNLQALMLDSNNLSGKIPSSIGNLTNIFSLGLSKNKLEGKIPLDIANCQHLQQIDISNNGLSGSIPREISGLSSSLIYLNLSRNKLSDILPAEVGKLKNIAEIDLSENNLTGEIPEAIQGCEDVEHFDLHGNSFQGTLPLAFASLRGLQYLDLSRNNLTGKIPRDLEKLRFVFYLNLSFNHLEGEVPRKGVFQNTSVVSLVGNTGLCSGVPELWLPRCTNKEIERKKTSGLRLTIVIVCVAAVFLLFSGFITLYWRRRSTKKSLPTVSTIGFLSKVSYSMLYKATNEFSPTMLIGVGSFSSVYKAILDEEDNPIAVKVLNLQKKGAEKSFIAECKALRTIRHRNLVKVLTCCSSTDHSGNDFKALVFEYMSNGSLEKWLHLVTNVENRSGSLSLIQRVNIAVDVASAIHYLHDDCKQSIIHRDLKPSNVLLDSEMIAHVSDFGLAKLISNGKGFSDGRNSTTGIKGTVGYVAPEYATGGEPSTQSDTYSYGILLLEMFTGRRPTDEIFKDDFNLHNFVKMALPERLVQVVDSALLPREVEETPMRSNDAMNESNNYNNGGRKIDEEQGNINYANANEISAHLGNCLVSVLEVGLSCSQESPNQRMKMGEVIRELYRIKNAYVSVGNRGRRRRIIS